jgi:hypothetical protein
LTTHKLINGMIIFCLCGIQWNDKEAAPKLQEFNNMRKNQTESHYTFRRLIISDH